ncbi:MAG: hypothetical protein LBP50_01050 [Tannerella sp.]|nr:hypothetical protein [Tannerella sp.]
MERENGKSYSAFADACVHYSRLIAKKAQDGIRREDTCISNRSRQRGERSQG